MPTKCSPKTPAGVIRASNFRLSISDYKGLVQSFNLEFQRQINRVFDLSDGGSFYYIEGPAQGKVGFDSIVGPKGAPSLDCDCAPQTITLDIGTAICQGSNVAPIRYQLLNAMSFGLQGGGDSESGLIKFGINYSFTDLVKE